LDIRVIGINAAPIMIGEKAADLILADTQAN
jgi:hypothetical protein